MIVSARGESFIKGFEQCRLKAYMPTEDDVPTIGWGSTGPDVHMGLVWTQEQADARFATDLAHFATSVGMAAGAATQTQGQFDAMVSLAYNIGIAAFRGSTLLRKHIAHDYAAAAEQFLRWDKQAGVVLKGLTRRRQAERRMYLGES